MAKKSFLVPFTVAIAALFGTAQAGIEPSSPAALQHDNLTTKSVLPGGQEVVYRQGEDLFSFVLQKNSSGQVYAYHSSHASHASHASHGSHRSHYSSR
jgi:hypothetical protein